MSKILSFYLIFFFTVSLYAQQQLHYSFAENPQTLLLNPGAETNYKYHYGIPLLSGFNLRAGTTGVTLEDLFIDNGTPFTMLLERRIGTMQPDDNVSINLRTDLLYGGYRLNDNDYLSFGLYQEVDLIAYYPKDMVELFYYGTSPYLNRNFFVSEVRAKADVLGVLHVGLSRKVNKRLNIGARFKIYSSSFNFETNNNSGTLTTYYNDTNILRQSIRNLDATVKTSGFIKGDVVLENPGDLYKKTFLNGNLGLGFDLGLTYHFSPQLEFTGSIVDIGFVKYSKNVRQYTASGDYDFDGIEFRFDEGNTDYWQSFSDDFESKIAYGDNSNKYTLWRPTKIHAALRYSFGELRRMQCYAPTHKRYYFNAMGIQYHSTFRPLRVQHAITAFFETSFTEKISSKVTYTINEYSSTLIGSGMSFQFGKVNLYGFIDNILGVQTLETAETASINFGVNFIIK